MDWNWFFSSIAQSAAAIVGIFGAFIITKVLSNQALFGEKTTRFRSLRTDASKLVASADNLAFAWYIRLVREHELEDAMDLLKKDGDLTADQLYAQLNFPIFLKRADAIHDLQNLKEARARAAEAERQRRIAEAQRQADRRKTLGAMGLSGFTTGLDEGARGFLAAPDFSPMRSLPHPWAELQKERDAIDALEVEIRHHMRTITDFLQTTASNPESSPAITWALVMVAALFLVGVVYPLSFLPTPINWTPAIELHGFWSRVFSLRGLLLTVVSIIFLAALTMFAVMNRRLRYPADDVRSLENFTHIGTYSPFFAIAEENKKLARASAPAE